MEHLRDERSPTGDGQLSQGSIAGSCSAHLSVSPLGLQSFLSPLESLPSSTLSDGGERRGGGGGGGGTPGVAPHTCNPSTLDESRNRQEGKTLASFWT